MRKYYLRQDAESFLPRHCRNLLFLSASFTPYQQIMYRSQILPALDQLQAKSQSEPVATTVTYSQTSHVPIVSASPACTRQFSSTSLTDKSIKEQHNSP